jgi:hypothetical protein
VKKLPQGSWTDTYLGKKCRVLYYSSKLKCYRVAIHGIGRWWVPVEAFKAPRYLPITCWDHILEAAREA